MKWWRPIAISCGSAAGLAMDAHETLIGEGIRSRVVSHFDEVDRRKRAERQRGQRIADVKHTEVDREIDADQTSAELEFRLIDF
jgi:hypothetical protein